MQKITVLIVDDNLAIRESLRSILKSHEDIEVVGAADSGLEAVTRAEELRPDLILMDAQMPEMDGVEATQLVKQRVPESKILFMVVHGTHIEAALAAGADGFMIKDSGRQELLNHIRKLGGHIETR